jgi:uncharacterized protein (DUF2235 family)
MKRVVVCCDGTWNEPDQKAGGAGCPTNVVKLAALVPPRDTDTEQRVLYHRGIGSDETRLRRWIEGATGLGITAALVDCYRWLIRNYLPGDELYFFGFSRGAYTARSLAGFVRNSGILRPENEDRLPDALRLYRSRDRRTEPKAAASRLFRQSYAWSLTTPIKCIGVWDTVGSLGVPNTMIQGVLKHVFRVKREFHDTDLSSTVAFAFHAVAIDERRQPFLPTIWTQSDDGARAGQHIEQVWFPGCHSDVGGGVSSSELSDQTLAWMVDRARQAGLVLLPVETIGPPDFFAFKPAATGPVHESLTWFYRLFFPSGVRGIDAMEEATHESISPEAGARWKELSNWRPAALADYLSRKG